MKRLIPSLLFALMFATLSRGVVAQDATPAASDSLIAGLGYPVIEYTTDGTTISGPTELEAGRYLLKVVSTSPIQEWEFTFWSPVEGMTSAELETELMAIDPLADEAPEIFYQVGQAGGLYAPATEALVQLSAGEWVATGVFWGEPGNIATLPVTVSGELPEFPPIEGGVDVVMADLSFDMPDTLAAGPQIWQVTNVGAIPHFVFVLSPGGEITDEEAVNGVKLFFGTADATPAAEGSVQDPMSWTEMGGSTTITTGQTTFFEIDLAPGTYIVSCFIEGPGDIGSHALHGMTKVFTVE